MAGKLGSVSCSDGVCIRGGSKLFIWEDCHVELEVTDNLNVNVVLLLVEMALAESPVKR